MKTLCHGGQCTVVVGALWWLVHRGGQCTVVVCGPWWSVHRDGQCTVTVGGLWWPVDHDGQWCTAVVSGPWWSVDHGGGFRSRTKAWLDAPAGGCSPEHRVPGQPVLSICSSRSGQGPGAQSSSKGAAYPDTEIKASPVD